MDPDIRKMVGRLDSQFGKLSGQVDEIRDSVRQVVAIAEADPEMALTKARKVLESVLRQVWGHHILDEPVGTRPLESVLQRLQKDGYLPRKQAAFAMAVKELGNVGAHVHDERVDRSDVVKALVPLVSILEWYFSQEWVEVRPQAAPPKPPAAEAPDLGEPLVDPAEGEAHSPLLVAGLRPRVVVVLAVAALLVVALLTWSMTGRVAGVADAGSAPNAESAPSSADGMVDETPKFQGRWTSYFEQVPLKGVVPEKVLARRRREWTIQGDTLRIVTQDVTAGPVRPIEGKASFRAGKGEHLFDFQGKVLVSGEPFALTGWYSFERGVLSVSCRPPEEGRPNAFPRPEDRGVMAYRFRRAGEAPPPHVKTKKEARRR